MNFIGTVRNLKKIYVSICVLDKKSEWKNSAGHMRNLEVEDLNLPGERPVDVIVLNSVF